jgi:ParD-like antitoxin of type II bacterial toxin-antitoxin system
MPVLYVDFNYSCLAALYGAKCAIKELFMTAAKAFASVKLPESLVQRAKEAALPLRRSAAGQIEYWATLGRVVEHSGLTVQEARAAIENYEAAAREGRQAKTDVEVALVDPAPDSLESVKQRILAASTDGSLQSHIRRIVADNRQKAELRKAA